VRKLSNFSLALIMHIGFAAMFVVLSLSKPAKRVIAPDRIQILQIDLKNVSGNETRLINREQRDDQPQRQANVKHKSGVNNKPTEPVLQTVRVNREIHSVDRTMTVSVIDAFRTAMTRCWNIDTTRPGLDGMRAVVHIELSQNGRVRNTRFEQASLADTDESWAYVFETIQAAINACNPFNMLPPNEYESWRNIRISFFPSARVIE